MSGARRSCPAAPAGPRGASSTKQRRVAPQPALRSAATERQLLDSLLLQIRDEVSSLTGAALSYELRGCQRLPKPETHTAAKVERHTGELLGALEGCLAKATRAHAAARRLSDAERRQREDYASYIVLPNVNVHVIYQCTLSPGRQDGRAQLTA